MVAVFTECAVFEVHVEAEETVEHRFEVHVEAEETVERRECDITSQDQMALSRHEKLTVDLI